MLGGVQFGLWARRQRGRTATWEYYGYGPDLPALPGPERMSDAEYADWRRKGMWFIAIEVVIVAVVTLVVGLITRSVVAIFLAALIVPCIVIGVASVATAALGVRRMRAHSLPAEPSGGGESANERPDEQRHPVV
jgi:hypothetical protein